MKIVVYGAEKRTGVIKNEHIIDIAGAVAKQEATAVVETAVESAVDSYLADPTGASETS